MAVTAYLDIDQGSDFTAEFTLENDDGTSMNLAGFSVYSQFRKSYGSTTSYTFTSHVVNGAGGVISISFSGDQSSSVRPGRYLYDVEIRDYSGNKIRVIEGILTINPEITRIP